MKFEFTNDEIFVLCAFADGESVTGVANPFIAMTDEEISAKLKSITNELELKGMIQKTDDRYEITEDYREIIAFILHAETTYIFVDEDETDEYVFMKGKAAVSMKNERLTNCYIEHFETIEAMKNFFRERFDFVKINQDPVQYMLSIPSDILDKAIEKAEANQMDAAIEVLDGDEYEKDEMESMLRAIVSPERSKTLIEYVRHHQSVSESVYKVFDTPSVSWMLKISTVDEAENTLVFKATVKDITEILFDF